MKVGEDAPEGSSISNELWDVLNDDVAGSYCANHVEHPRPSPASVADAAAETKARERLAGKAAADDVDGRSNSASPPLTGGPDIVMAWHLRPVAGEDFAAVGVELHLSDGGHACTLEAELQPAYTGEQRQHVHGATARKLPVVFPVNVRAGPAA